MKSSFGNVTVLIISDISDSQWVCTISKVLNVEPPVQNVPIQLNKECPGCLFIMFPSNWTKNVQGVRKVSFHLVREQALINKLL